MSDHDDEDVLGRYQQLHGLIGEAGEQCHRRTIGRISREGYRLAKRHRNLIEYLSFSFNLFNNFEPLHDDFAESTDVIVESISLLEDPTKAREFDSSFDERMYEYTRWWMLPTSYHALATLAGCQHGDNSPGLHHCINEGINVCRRLGSSKDKILMFREFAVEVQVASDDLEMALHTARESLQFHSDTGRKVASADDIASILALQGRFTESCEMIVEGFNYCQQFHNPYMALLNFVPMAREIASIAGRRDVLDLLPIQVAADEKTDLPEDRILRTPDADEHVLFEYVRQQSQAIELACAGDYERAIQILQHWDKHLYARKNLNRWFVTRCRLIALHRLNGDIEQARVLAKPTEVMARRAHDWLALNKLGRLLDESIPANPYATVAEPDCGPYASKNSTAARTISSSHLGSLKSETTPSDVERASHESASIETSSEETESTRAEAALPDYIEALYDELEMNEGSDETIANVARRVLSFRPHEVASPTEAEHLLRLAGLERDPSQIHAGYAWGKSFLQAFPTSADVLSMVASYWSHLQELSESEEDSPIEAEEMVNMFRKAMDMDIHSAKTFYRAGSYFFSRQNFPEAERCLARAFRLDRKHSAAARTLAKTYNYTDRPRDALTVLDMCLREGSDDPNVAWEAALQANIQEQHASILIYLDRFESLVDKQPWSDYYRALALQELNRPDEALEALGRERKLNPDSEHGVLLQHASARAMQGDSKEFREDLQRVLDTSLSEITTLTRNGLLQLFKLLWKSVSRTLPQGEPLRHALEQKLLSACLAPDELFEVTRLGNKETESEQSVRYFQIYLNQSLEGDWEDSSGCLAAEREWTQFTILWRVLAEDQTQAEQFALDWQGKSFQIPATVEYVEQGDQEFLDYPGVVGQGPRYVSDPPLE
jgi:tetratricopeptide (TPR) repeat protein